MPAICLLEPSCFVHGPTNGEEARWRFMGRGVTPGTAFSHYDLMWIWGRREGKGEREGFGISSSLCCLPPDGAPRSTCLHLGQGDPAWAEQEGSR